MKKIILFIATLAFADISSIINEIKEMESFKPRFEVLVKYDLFDKTKVIKNPKQTVIKTTVIAEPKLYLKAIFNDKANINGKWLRVGDEIEGYKVVKIDENGVVLRKFRKTIYLKVKISVLKVEK